MTQILKMVLSMSLSGTLLILVVLPGVRLLNGRLGRQWQYYIWLIVVMRLLLPFGPKENLMRRVYGAADRMIAQMTQTGEQMRRSGLDEEQNKEPDKGEGLEQNARLYDGTEDPTTVPADGRQLPANADSWDDRLPGRQIFSAVSAFAGQYLWVIWLVTAFCMLIRKMTIYQSYVKHVTAAAEPVNDVLLLDWLAVMAKQAGIGKAVELCVNPLVSSPMLVGYFHPCIVLPDEDVSKKDFPWIVMHELTHYKRRDILYKWLVQVTVCLHWFNPLVRLMSREIDKACEFSCDEAVVAKMGYDCAADYGKTLLDAMATGGIDTEAFAAVTMSANKKLLRERLDAIMKYKKKTKGMVMVTAALTICVALGAVLIGVYPAAAAEKTSTVQEEPEIRNETAWADVERFYEAGSLPQFYIAFYELDKKEQEIWLNRIYEDEALPFFSAGVWALDADIPLISSFAEKFYGDGNTAFFSVLAEVMDEETLEGWLDRAVADQKLNFQSMLYHELGRDDQMDEKEKALAEEQRKAYEAVGVTWNGKNCYYRGELVHIFLDIHTPSQAFYTLDMNPAGTADIKIIRTQEGQITGVAYMSDAEVAELFGDIYEDTQEPDALREEEPEVISQEMVVTMPACNIREGAGEEYQVVGIIGKGEQVTVLGKVKGTGGKLWYLLDQESLPQPPDPLVEACYIRGDLLQESNHQ